MHSCDVCKASSPLQCNRRMPIPHTPVTDESMQVNVTGIDLHCDYCSSCLGTLPPLSRPPHDHCDPPRSPQHPYLRCHRPCRPLSRPWHRPHRHPWRRPALPPRSPPSPPYSRFAQPCEMPRLAWRALRLSSCSVVFAAASTAAVAFACAALAARDLRFADRVPRCDGEPILSSESSSSLKG